MALYGNPHVTGVARHFETNEVIVTKTDLKGKMTYCNRTFYQVSGLTEKECIGMPHNIIRHPQMPRCVFKLLWDTVSKGDEIFAYVNNRAKNGDHYWVFAHVTPSFDKQKNIIGYHSNRRVPNQEIIQKHIAPLYGALLDIEKSIESPSAGLDASTQKVTDFLQEQKMSFNEFMFSLGV